MNASFVGRFLFSVKHKQVALEVLEQLSQRCHISLLCKEIFYLLQKPHVQVNIFSAFSFYNENFHSIQTAIMFDTLSFIQYYDTEPVGYS